MELDGVQIGVSDLDAAMEHYRLLLGIEPLAGTPAMRRFQLGCGAIELHAGPPGSLALLFAGGMSENLWPSAPEAFHGVAVRLAASNATVAQTPIAPDCVSGIDHVVIHTPHIERAVALWRDRLGLRLALEREFPARGVRMLFFRSAGMTIEFVAPLAAPADACDPDQLWGLAYRVADLPACCARLQHGGIDVSEIRPGQKRGTWVTTVRSAAVPTLLISEGQAQKIRV